MRSGYIDNYKGVGLQPLRYASIYGYPWSSSAIEESDSITAYYLHFNASDVYSSGGPYHRRLGFPLRCLSTTAVGGKNQCVITKKKHHPKAVPSPPDFETKI